MINKTLSPASRRRAKLYRRISALEGNLQVALYALDSVRHTPHPPNCCKICDALERLDKCQIKKK